jgi:site-specific recombinase XerC
MSNEIATLEQPEGALATLTEIAGEYAKASKADNTWRAYANSWQSFARWCEVNKVEPLPTTLRRLAAYVIDSARSGRKLATIRVDIAAIRARNHSAGHGLDTDAPDFAAVWAGIRRKHAAPQRRADALTTDDVAAILALPVASLIEKRDRALVALGVMAALRGPSELLQLDWQEMGTGNASLAIDVRGITITLRTSKTSQTEAQTVVIPRKDAPGTVAAIEELASAMGLLTGAPVFQRIRKGDKPTGERLAEDGLMQIVRRAIARVLMQRGASAIEAERMAQSYSTHSLRAGGVTSLALKGVSDSRIMAHSRHASAAMVSRYTRVADQWGNSPLKAVGV